MNAIFSGLAVILFLFYGIAQLYAGYLGIEHHFSPTWGWIALIASFVLRFTLPITIGSFFGALDVWHWHLAGAVVFAAPGLLLVVPGVLAAITSSARR